VPSPTRSNGWYQVHGRWARSLGERGACVRLFQKRRGGAFYRQVWVRGKSDRACLQTRNRTEAERLGKQLLARLLQGEVPQAGRLTLAELWERYRTEAPNFLDNLVSTQRDDEGRAAILLSFFGPNREVRTLSARDQAAYIEKRLRGGLTKRDGRPTRPVRTAAVKGDLDLLHMMLSWATTVRVEDGSRLMQEHPLAGVRRPHEKNPRRPVATVERYQATRTAMQELCAKAADDLERTRWIKMELALVLAEATGRRLGSIRQLRWEDVDFEHRRIRWRAEADKKRRESVVPVPQHLIDELRLFRRKLGAVAGWVFAGERMPDQPMDRHLFDKWLTVAEKAAEVPKLEGGLWHPYRRKWATERKQHALKDVAAAGGWKDVETLLTCYQQPDEETLLAVMSEPRKLREAGLKS